MVKDGDFTVQLVRADTKEAFTEHTSSHRNEVYAEVEPDLEYYIGIGTQIGAVKAYIAVDGVSLGYCCDFGRPKPMRYRGAIECRNGVYTYTSLRFNTTRSSGINGGGQSMLTGKVEVKFYRYGEKYYKETKEDFESRALTASSSSVGGKKCVMSTKGSTSFSTEKKSNKSIGDGCKEEGKNKKNKPHVGYKRGEYLCTITLHYCTALGLIHHKVLGAPPDLLESSNNPVNEDTPRKKRSGSNGGEKVVEHIASSSQKKVKREVETVIIQKSCDLVDLTGGNDEEEE